MEASDAHLLGLEMHFSTQIVFLNERIASLMEITQENPSTFTCFCEIIDRFLPLLKQMSTIAWTKSLSIERIVKTPYAGKQFNF